MKLIRNTTLFVLATFVAAMTTTPRDLVQAATALEPQSFSALGQRYFDHVRPLMDQYCFDCHEGPDAEAEIDLAQITTFNQLREDPNIWIKVDEMLESRQMPPKKSDQPTEAERDDMDSWVKGYLALEAKAFAGDPGRVTLRRLNNSEYTYTIRDLTGLSTLNPTDEFPVDGAAGEGFINTGDALSISPSMIQKYLDAAKGIAAHAVLLPNGIQFSPHSTRRDWTDEFLASIRSFYSRYTDSGGGMAVNLQGIQFDTNQGGVLPLERYLSSLNSQRNALSERTMSIADLSQQSGLNAKYLRILWRGLFRQAPSDSSILMDRLRAHIKSQSAIENVTNEIAAWQKSLWQLTSIGHIGREGGPDGWLVEQTPLVNEQPFSLDFPDLETPSDRISIHLQASSAGDGSIGDIVIWKNPRLTGAGLPDLPLRDVLAHEQDIRFGKHPLGLELSSTDLAVQAPNVVSFSIPASIARGRKLVTSASLDPQTGHQGSVQVSLDTLETKREGLDPGLPILVTPNSETELRWKSAFHDFRQLFPPVLCYTTIVPVDEVVTLTLFYREDKRLQRLMLDENEKLELDRLWEALLYVSREPLELVTAYEQITAFSTQDRPDLVEAWKPAKNRILNRAMAFQKRLIGTESIHLRTVLEFADQAWRRPLETSETASLEDLYHGMREEELEHEQAIRLLIARVLTAPAFLYRLEKPGPDVTAITVSNLELASRLSYFLWSSQPDPELRRLAEAGKLSDDVTLTGQIDRMLTDARARRLAIEFGCQWLHLRDFDQNDDKNEKLYPEFALLRESMYEEVVRFFTDLIQNNGSVLDLLNANHTFLNGALASHYGMESVTGSQWRRVEGIDQFSRGGLLGMASVLSLQSGASRTSPILRGHWVSETLLGERLPRPPLDVPVLPETVPKGLTARELIERHSSAPACAKCHERIDPYGFAMEQFDAIGRRRPMDVNTSTQLMDGRSIEGFEGLKNYLSLDRRDAFIEQFCRKLLGYALGRSVQLSDRPLLESMRERLSKNNYRFHTLVKSIATSPQFRQIRGRFYGSDQ